MQGHNRISHPEKAEEKNIWSIEGGIKPWKNHSKASTRHRKGEENKSLCSEKVYRHRLLLPERNTRKAKKLFDRHSASLGILFRYLTHRSLLPSLSPPSYPVSLFHDFMMLLRKKGREDPKQKMSKWRV